MESLTQIISEAEQKWAQVRRESDPNFRSIEGSTLQAAVLIQSLGIIEQLMKKDHYDVRNRFR
jgi:hypothetical protein